MDDVDTSDYYLQKPYRCEVFGCQKRYTDPSSLRKHVKNHTKEEQEQVKQTRDSSKARSRHSSQEGWLEPEHLNGNMTLLSGGGVVASGVDQFGSLYDTQYRGQIEECGLSSYGWGRREEDRECYTEQSRRKEEEERIHFYNTPLYLEV